MLTTTHYHGFDYQADKLLKFLAVLDFFTIMLKDGTIVHFTPACTKSFRQWLLDNDVADIGKRDV